MANNIKSTNLPLILTGRGVKPTVPSNIRAVFGDDDFDVTSDLMVGQQAYNVDDDIWYYRNKKGISTLGNDSAIISPNGEVYIPADAETPNFISMAFDNNQTDKVYKFNNNTETYQNLDLSNYDQGLSTLVEGAGNDIMIIRLITGTTYIYKAIGVNIDNTLNDVSSGIGFGSSSSSGESGIDIERYAYITDSGFNGFMQVYQHSGPYRYEYVIRTNYNTIHLNIPASDYAWYGLEKLNEQWFIIYEQAVNDNNLYAKAIINWSNFYSSPDHIIDLSSIYTSSDSPAYRLIRTIPSSYVYYDVNTDYPLLPGLYETDGRWGVVFNDDPMMYHHSYPSGYNSDFTSGYNSDFTSDLIHDYDNAYSIIGLVDSPTRKILIVRYGKSYSLSFYDVDNQEYIEPTYSPNTYTLDNYSDSIYNNVHELSNGTFVAVVDHRTFTSPDLRTWNMIIGTYGAFGDNVK